MYRDYSLSHTLQKQRWPSTGSFVISPHVRKFKAVLSPPPPPQKKKVCCNTQEKLKTKVMQNLGGEEGVLWEMCKWRIISKWAQFQLRYPSVCLVPVRRFSSPFRSIHVGDVSEANGRRTPWQKQNECVAFWNSRRCRSCQVNSRQLWFLKQPLWSLWIFAGSTLKSHQCSNS